VKRDHPAKKGKGKREAMSEPSELMSKETLNFIGGGIVVSFLLGLLWKIRRGFRKATGVGWSTECSLDKRDAVQNSEIYTELVGLRVLTNADRAYVLRFHNGTEFLPSHPAWKLSCTHEIVKNGVTYEAAKLQNVLVSLIPNIINPILTGSSSAAGIVVPECPECPFQQKCLRENKRVVVAHVDEMESSFCKHHLQTQNIRTSVMCGIAIGGSVFGIVGIDICGIGSTPEQIVDMTQKVCRATEQIQFLLKFNR
jgi:hypothetical protein